LSYQAGHNSTIEGPVSITPDPYVTLYYPTGDSNDSRCGATLNEDAAQLAWFNQYLKGEPGAASIVPTNPCISLSSGDAVTVPVVPTFTSGPPETPYDVGSMTLVAGTNIDVPTATVLYTAGANGDVEVGIPHMQINVSYAADGVSTGSPIVYVGLGIKHASNNALWDLVDNNVLPVRGTGYFDLDMIGGGARLLPGDQLGFLVFGAQDQYASAGNVSAPSPTVVPVTITGKVFIPDIGPMPSNV
jgi:ABC-2 type transport system ATP-binding protein